MSELDIKIKNIFTKLINSGTKYLTKISIFCRELEYNINGTSVLIQARLFDRIRDNNYTTFDDVFYRTNTEYSMINKSFEENCRFYIVIDNKYYNVLPISRTERAQIIDKIEATIMKYEESILNKISEEL